MFTSSRSRRGMVALAFSSSILSLLLLSRKSDAFTTTSRTTIPLFATRQPLALYKSTRTTNSATRSSNSKTGLFMSGGGINKKGSFGNGMSVIDFLNAEDSPSVSEAKEMRSEASLPISYDYDNDDNNDEDEKVDVEVNQQGLGESNDEFDESLNMTAILNKNPYLNVVSRLAPSDLISKFTTSAHPRVQNAVRSTILGLIGSLPKMAFDTTTITTGERLASLMFQLQMTGYMFKNAEYRLSLSRSLGVPPTTASGESTLFPIPTEDEEDIDDDEFLMDRRKPIDPLSGRVKGKIKVKYGQKRPAEDENDLAALQDNRMVMEVDAAAYMYELRAEVSKLRDALELQRQEREDAIKKDLLLYIRTLPEQQLKSLTSTVSEDVLVAMKGLVNVVMAGIGDGQIKPGTVTEQSGEAMAQLCMWQLVVGYNLRELEVREEMKQSFQMESVIGGAIDSETTTPAQDKDGSSSDGTTTSTIDFYDEEDAFQ